ncbi:MAG TPA: hypothetical protein VIC62_16740, partial [Nakamurella sp.]
MLKVGLALAAVPLVISACSSGGSSSGTTSAATSAAGSAATSAAATGGGAASASTLTVWADNSANTGKAIQPLCEKWAAENGVTCVMRMFNGGT